MTTCPNCGRQITDDVEICPNCHFNVQKYRDTFFSDQYEQEKYEDEHAGAKIASRKIYRQEFYPEKQNSTVKKMLLWIHKNSMIVFLVGIMLLIVMSFSRGLGWLCFCLLLLALFWVCARQDRIERYTVDERLTQKANQLGSNFFNKIEDGRQKRHPKSEQSDSDIVKQPVNYVQLSIILTALISLVVLFTSGSVDKVSLTKVFMGLVGRMFENSTTVYIGIQLCLIWVLLIIFPLIIMRNTLRNTKKAQWLAFALSLIESVFLLYLLFRLSTDARANVGLLNHVTSQLIVYVVSFRTSIYFLIFASVMTTGLTCYNLIKKRQ
ncbi:zinc ribbon domain-containing protein [Lactobacillus sp. ESL0684]|uniref:zinc ribbon domain-containing protein n=1 Tax=Lactobacillus sp. ESL0684 TaxID=2983213 RepID=UPI0023F99F5A|nr:zinc ribbon domain-containing protein [Lactobacillus sp. ESL0684]WEV43899.1 zinc ribbon domain-containing protein [Lactobacillus sp. ESL0684]